MPAAWAMPSNKIKVMVATPWGGNICFREWAYMFRKLRVPGNHVVIHTSGQPIHVARNQLVREMFKNNAEYIFFLDSDVVPHRDDIILKLLEHEKPIVSGIYHKRFPPFGPCIEKNTDMGVKQWIDHPQGLIEVDYVGAGCLLVHNSVFKRMTPPWFHWTLDQDNPDPEIPLRSEDYYFNRKARKLGYKIWVDTTLRCDHLFIGKITPANEAKIVSSL